VNHLNFFQVFKGALFRTATEQKEQTRYFSKRVMIPIPFIVIFNEIRFLLILAVCPTDTMVKSSVYLQDIQELFSLPQQGFDVSLTQQQLQEEHGQQLVM
jgi:hypothetical protein